MRYCLKLADGLAKLFALPRITHASLDLALHGSQIVGQDGSTFPFHGTIKNGCTRSLRAETVLFRNFTILEDDLSHGRGTKPHFLNMPAQAESGRTFVDHESSDPLNSLGP